MAMQGTNAHAVLASKSASTESDPRQAAPLWQRRRHWFTPSRPHSLLGSAIFQPTSSRIMFACDLIAPRLGYLWDHQVSGRALFPGAAMFELATACLHTLRAGSEVPYGPHGAQGSTAHRPAALTGVTIPAALVLTPWQALSSGQSRARPVPANARQQAAAIGAALDVRTGAMSIQSGPGTTHLIATSQQASLAPDPARKLPPVSAQVQAALPQVMQAWQDATDRESAGVEEGCGGKGLQQQQQPTAVVLLDPPTGTQQGASYHIHPAVLDCCTQAGSAFRTLTSDGIQDTTVRVPAGLAVYVGPPAQPEIAASMVGLATFAGLRSDGTVVSDYSLLGEPAPQPAGLLRRPSGSEGRIIGMEFKPVGVQRPFHGTPVPHAQASFASPEEAEGGLYTVAWEAQTPIEISRSTSPAHQTSLCPTMGMAWQAGQMHLALKSQKHSLVGVVASLCKGLMFVQRVTNSGPRAPRQAGASDRQPSHTEIVLQQSLQLDGLPHMPPQGHLAAAASAALMKVAAQEHRALSWYTRAMAHTAPAVTSGDFRDDAEAAVAPGVQCNAHARSVACMRSRSNVDHSPPEAAVDAAFGSGTVLVTGGLGDIGSLVGQWLAAAHTCSDLHMLGRSGRTKNLAPYLQSSPACITLARCDVACAEDSSTVAGPSTRSHTSQPTTGQAGACVGALQARLHPLVGVVHAGGVLQDGLLARQTPAAFRGVLAPKVCGALQMVQPTALAPLAATINFSSLAGLLGTAGQGNYAAANAALDAFTEGRANAGAPTVSLLWGPWATGMAAAAPGLIAGFQKAGLGVVQPAAGLAVLAHALGSTCLGSCHSSSLVAAPFIFARICALDMPFLPLFDPWRPEPMSSPPGQFAQSGPLQGTTAVLPHGGRVSNSTGGLRSAQDIMEEVRQIISRTLGRSVDDSEPLMEAGLDSLGAVELRTTLSNSFSLDLPATITFDYPSTAALAGYVAAQAPTSKSLQETSQLDGQLQAGHPLIAESGLQWAAEPAAGATLEPHQVQAQLQQTVQGMLGCDIGLDQPLMEAGLDSLGAVELRNTISSQFNIDLPATVMFDYPSISALAGFIASQAGTCQHRPSTQPLSALRHYTSLQVGQSVQSGLQDPTYLGAYIVSAASCYPTAPTGPESFWSTLTSGRDVQSLVPYSRWDMDAVYAPDPGPGRMTIYARFGGFCRDVDLFDAGLFRMAPTEAVAVDPQQRLLMEQAYLAQSEASAVLGHTMGSATGMHCLRRRLC